MCLRPMRAPKKIRQTMVVHGKIRWTSSRCVVAYGGHAPMAKWSEFEFEKESQISNSNITHVGARF